eukprot:GHUV01039655.1.p1 GENE.GHUV01039655.1~~GHUV01039655.1.p1  ORF type:complete len:139 (-),score=46.75 GHUV01039655.1:64-480(-)
MAELASSSWCMLTWQMGMCFSNPPLLKLLSCKITFAAPAVYKHSMQNLKSFDRTQVDDNAGDALDDDDDDLDLEPAAATAADLTAAANTAEADKKKSVRLAAGLDGGLPCCRVCDLSTALLKLLMQHCSLASPECECS